MCGGVEWGLRDIEVLAVCPYRPVTLTIRVFKAAIMRQNGAGMNSFKEAFKTPAVKALVAEIRQNAAAMELKLQTERQQRIDWLHYLMDLNRVPMAAPKGYTSRAERLAKQFGYDGGEDFDNAVEVLKHARASKEAWETCLDCFGPQAKQ